MQEKGEATDTARLVCYDVNDGSVATVFPEGLQDIAFASEVARRLHSIGRDYQWSPSGRYIAYTAPISEGVSLDPRKGVAVPIDYAVWGTPHMAEQRLGALFVLDVATARATQLTPDDVSAEGFAWAPDERALAVVVLTNPGRYEALKTNLLVINRATRESRVLLNARVTDPVWSPNGRWVAAADALYHQPVLVSPDGDGSQLSIAEDMPTVSALIGWSADSRTLLYEAFHHMLEPLVKVDVRNRTFAVLPSGKSELAYESRRSMSNDRRWIAYTSDSVAVPPEIFIAPLDISGRPKRRSRQISTLSPNFSLSSRVQVEQLSWRSEGMQIHGLLVTPTDAWTAAGIRQPLPTLLWYVGGPDMVAPDFYQSRSSHAAPAYTERGYAVFMPNTRGRGGYGRGSAFVANTGVFKGDDSLPFRDAMAGIDLLISRGITDPQRLGVAGHSYGGHMTNITITYTRRFKASMNYEGSGKDYLERSMRLPARTDLGPMYEQLYMDTPEYHGLDPEVRDLLIRNYPELNMHRVTTPSLLICGVKASAVYSCRITLNSLRKNYIPSVHLVYDEGHGIARPAAFVDYVENAVAWMDYWVRGIAYPAGERRQTFEKWKNDWENSPWRPAKGVRGNRGGRAGQSAEEGDCR